MNSMTSISHRLFAAALADDPVARKGKPAAGQPVTINVGHKSVTPVWSNGQPKPTHRLISNSVWPGGTHK